MLAIVAGVVLVVALFLPWANKETDGDVNYALSKPRGLNGVLQTQWGWPALLIAVCVIILAVMMVARRPGRVGVLLGLALASGGVAAVAVASDAATSIGAGMSPGLGMYLTVLAGVLLAAIGIAAAMVAVVLLKTTADSEAHASSPSTAGSAPHA